MRGLSCDAVLDIGAGEGYWLRAASVNKPCMAIEPNAASGLKERGGLRLRDRDDALR